MAEGMPSGILDGYRKYKLWPKRASQAIPGKTAGLNDRRGATRLSTVPSPGPQGPGFRRCRPGKAPSHPAGCIVGVQAGDELEMTIPTIHRVGKQNPVLGAHTEATAPIFPRVESMCVLLLVALPTWLS